MLLFIQQGYGIFRLTANLESGHDIEFGASSQKQQGVMPPG